MRTHSDYAYCQLWPYGPAEREIIGAGHIAVARFESIRRSSKMWGWLDVVFAHAGETTLVSGILVDVVAASRNDAAALLFPHRSAAALGEERAWELTAFLLPHLRMLTRARAVPIEEVMDFLPCAPFDRARASGELGAAPLPLALARMAPWVAAARLAGAGPMAIHAPDWALGAAVARCFRIPVTAASSVADDPWYRIRPGTADGAPEVTVAQTFAERGAVPICVALKVEDPAPGARAFVVPKPLPMEAVFTCDPDDAPEVRRYWVEAPDRPVAPMARARLQPRTPAMRVAFLVRDDFLTAPDADTDELGELALRARGAGIDVAFGCAVDVAGLDAGVLPVACGALDDPAFAQVLAGLEARGERFAVMLTPAAGDAAAPYEAALARVVSAEDDALLEAASRALAERPLGEGIITRSLPAAVRSQFTAGLAAAAVVVPAVPDGVDAVGPIVPSDSGADGASAVSGGGAFIFAHASGTARSGLFAIALALRDSEIACVIVAEAADLGYVAELRRIAGLRTIVLTNASAGLLDSLYRRATIFVDPSLRPRGMSRIARAARHGALPVVFADSPLAAVVAAESIVPRRTIGDLRETLERVWRAPARSDQRSPAAAFGDPRAVDAATETLIDHFARLGA